VKANGNQAVLRMLARLGAGMDIVSEGELRRALAAGVPGERIVFSGIGKTEPEMAAALDARILCFNVESEPELETLSGRDVEGRDGPGFHPRQPRRGRRTHAKISTGRSENKFGIPLSTARDAYRRGRRPARPADRRRGHAHRQPDHGARTLRERDEAPRRTRPRPPGPGYPLEHIDLGGGLGVPYRPDDEPPLADAYAAAVKRHTRELGLTLVFEVGRLIAANAGILLTRVLFVKRGENKTFVIVDAGMNDLIRPTLYDAHHDIRPVTERTDEPVLADVVGPVCESGDYLALARELPPVEPGDLLAVMTAGAYGAVQSSTYNTRLLVPEVMVRGADWAVVRPRTSYDELIGLDRVPDWLA
jgi:diaminopimelate decarboxylase